MFRHACSVVAVAVAALVLSGCFTLSKNLPAGGAPPDERLLGAWRGLEGDEKKDSDAFLHFVKPDGAAPMKLVWVEDRNYQVYEFHTIVAGGKTAFAAKLLTPFKDGDDSIPDGYFLGFYEFRGANEIVFSLLDAEKVGELIGKGRLKGTRPPGKYEFASLTGSPTELAAFLASPDAQKARVDEPATIRRLTRAPK